MKAPLSIIALALLAWTGCKEEALAPVAPVLTLVSISPTTVTAHTDSVRIALIYSDAQGDIGESDPDSASLRVRDSRLNADDWYHVPPLTPNQIELDIEGEFHVQIPPLFLLGNGEQETTTLSFQLFDRAGNPSNEVTSETILILDTLR